MRPQRQTCRLASGLTSGFQVHGVDWINSWQFELPSCLTIYTMCFRCFKICVQGLNNQQIQFSDDIMYMQIYKFGKYRNDAFLSDFLVVSWEQIIKALQVINFKRSCLDT